MRIQLALFVGGAIALHGCNLANPAVGAFCWSSSPCPNGLFCVADNAEDAAGSLGTCQANPASGYGGTTCQIDPASDVAITCRNNTICAPTSQCAGPQYTDSGDGTVKDDVTGLTWQQAVSTNPCAADGAGVCTWSDAKAYCASLSLNGADWRLPSAVELFSLVEIEQSPSIDSTSFPNTPSNAFWTSTPAPPSPGLPDEAVLIGFYSSALAFDALTVGYPVRCVRGVEVAVDGGSAADGG